MPNWKKVIVSGSNASLNSLSVSTSITATSFTGSLQGTSSWANNAISASYFSGSISNSVSASYALTASFVRDVAYVNVNNRFTTSQTITGSLTVTSVV